MFNFNLADLPIYLMRIPVMLLAISIHESAHAYAALKLGDPTARNFGRISMNPLKHLNIYGTIMMVLFGFGWANPVPINARNFKNPKTGMALSALAGPASNIILGFIGYLLMRIFFVLVPAEFILTNAGYAIWLFFEVLVVLNISFAIFNFLPVPPLDGSRILYVFLPSKYYFQVMKYEQYISLAIIAAALFGLLDRPMSMAMSGVLWTFDKIVSFIPFLQLN